MTNLTRGRVIILLIIAGYLAPLLYTNPTLLADVWLVLPMLVIAASVFHGLNRTELRTVRIEINEPELVADSESDKNINQII